MWIRVLALGLTACLMAATTCAPQAQSSDRLQIVTALYPIEEAARHIAGDRADVVNLAPPGAEPHDLELRPSDLRRLRSADLILYIGAGFQPALEDAIVALQDQDRAVDLLEGLPLLGSDPHVWLSPPMLRQLASRISDALAALDPSHASEFAQLADALGAQLASLDSEFQTGLQTCDRREIFTSHAAFAYLTREYGLTQIAISGLQPEAEPSSQKLQEVAELARQTGATTIFFETLVSPRVSETVARNAGAKTAVLNPIEGLSDEQREAGEDYFSVMRSNLRALIEALGCR